MSQAISSEEFIAAPHRHDAVFAAMRKSEMNDWVGGGDPKIAGVIMASSVRERLRIDEQSSVLDFGCGNGRVAVGFLGDDPQPRHYVGFDIVPALVDFCRAEIAPTCPVAAFELIEGDNSYYDKFKQGTTLPRSRDALTASYGNSFSHGFAISVFTHLDVEAFQRELRFIASLLRPGGTFLFSAFTLTRYARSRIPLGSPHFDFGRGEYRDEGGIFVASSDDPLAFVAYDSSLIEAFVEQSGLVITSVDYGQWMGGEIGHMLHDHYVCRKP